jgi:hypothetical protein
MAASVIICLDGDSCRKSPDFAISMTFVAWSSAKDVKSIGGFSSGFTTQSSPTRLPCNSVNVLRFLFRGCSASIPSRVVHRCRKWPRRCPCVCSYKVAASIRFNATRSAIAPEMMPKNSNKSIPISPTVWMCMGILFHSIAVLAVSQQRNTLEYRRQTGSTLGDHSDHMRLTAFR